MGLTLNNVDLVYSGVIQVLRSVNLEIPDGQMVVLLGSNGAGKTTNAIRLSPRSNCAALPAPMAHAFMTFSAMLRLMPISAKISEMACARSRCVT